MKISVCMASYNGERYISQQLISILRQLGRDDELVISDDGSTDSTLSIIDGFEDSRIVLMVTRPCGNPIFNFEKAIAAARGDVIVLSDQDDIWLDGRIDMFRRLFTGRESDFFTVSLDSSVVDGDLVTLYSSLFEHLNAGPGIIKNIIRNGYVGCHMAFTRKVMEVALPFPENIPMHDVWIGLISELYGDVMFERSRPTMLFRRHGENATKFGIPLIQKLKWRFALIWNVGKVALRKSFFGLPR